MAYSKTQSCHLLETQRSVSTELDGLLLQFSLQAESSKHPKVKEHLTHGAGRRVGVLSRSIQNVYTLFPPTTAKPLPREILTDVQINLQAFMMNLYGLLDNLAWAFVFRHGLDSKINKLSVGIFSAKTLECLPQEITDYLSTETAVSWRKYLKSYRDALAHRIPLYIPPAEFTAEDGVRYNQLETEKIECIKAMKWERLEEVYAEQASIGAPSFCFLHSFEEGDLPSPILIHPQMLSDARGIVEFGNLFLDHWHCCR